MRVETYISVDRSFEGLREVLFREIEDILNNNTTPTRTAQISKMSSNILTSVREQINKERFTKNSELISDNVYNTHNKIISPIEINLLSDTFLSSTPGCDECAYQPYCGADPLYHLATQGDHVGNKAISDYCKLQRYLFDYFFELLNDTSRKEILLKWLK